MVNVTLVFWPGWAVLVMGAATPSFMAKSCAIWPLLLSVTWIGWPAFAVSAAGLNFIASRAATVSCWAVAGAGGGAEHPTRSEIRIAQAMKQTRFTSMYAIGKSIAV